MVVDNLLHGLNDKQIQAVLASGNQLILAGAGSGKTKVLTHKIAWLMQTNGVSQHAILAVTFTNKAASQMRSRIESLIPMHVHKMWIGTFHGLGYRLLRAHYQDAGLLEKFQIIDAEDQLRQIKRLLKSLNVDEEQYPAKLVRNYINDKKEKGLRAEHLEHNGYPIEKMLIELYRVYQSNCDRAGLVDFAEILIRSHELLLNNSHILAHYQERFKYILVDEFQDTNSIQYAWIRLLAGGNSSIIGVGDDDQSIYGWRGADSGNMQKFMKDYKITNLIKLEQNYRSTAKILNAANSVINRNTQRIGKALWTEDKEGDEVKIYRALNEQDEAEFIVSKIKHWHRQGNKYSDCAILYRNNALSRVLEEAFLYQQVPYRIYGGMRFFERQEIKDVISYLRLMVNFNDDAAFERIVNVPSRKIGTKTLEVLRSLVTSQNLTMWNAAKKALEMKILTGRSATAIAEFIDLIENLSNDVESISLDFLIDKVIIHSGLKQMYSLEKDEKIKDRVSNLEELVNAAKTFKVSDEFINMPVIDAFLANAALESGDKQADKFVDSVQLMTLHVAKGLEFPWVAIVGVEEDLFPSANSVSEGRLEEERRLCYVGMTRAMQQLYLTFTDNRRVYGSITPRMASRFIGEIDQSLLEFIGVHAKTKRVIDPIPIPRFDKNEASFRVGQQVVHPTFGEGTIIGLDGTLKQEKVEVFFKKAGTKKLVVAYARLEAI